MDLKHGAAIDLPETGLAGYGAYKQEKARGASDARASLRGAVKGTGAYLGAKGGFNLAQMLSKRWRYWKGLAGAVLGYSTWSQLAATRTFHFKAFAGATYDFPKLVYLDQSKKKKCLLHLNNLVKHLLKQV